LGTGILSARSDTAHLDQSRKLVTFLVMATAARFDTARAAALFHALADEIRVEVVTLLLHGERCVCELMDDLGLAQSRLSWHLKTLADAGIISGRKEGRWVYYSLNADALGEARAILDAIKPNSRRLATRTACCD
jgi:ArsR family transcriptional regulator